MAFCDAMLRKNTVSRAHASQRFVAMNTPFGPFSPKLLQISLNLVPRPFPLKKGKALGTRLNFAVFLCKIFFRNKGGQKLRRSRRSRKRRALRGGGGGEHATNVLVLIRPQDSPYFVYLSTREQR